MKRWIWVMSEDTITKESVDFVTGSSTDKDEKKGKKAFNPFGLFKRK